jgi:hypothetical protein
MSAQLTLPNRRNKWAGHFPGDPRYESSIFKAPAAHISCLGQDVFLAITVLDCILQLSAVVPPALSEDFLPPMIGSLTCETFMSGYVTRAFRTDDTFQTIAACNANERKVSNLRNILSDMLHPNPPPDVVQRLIIPISNGLHFSVACIDFSVNDPNFFVEISLYDSLKPAQTEINEMGAAAIIVKNVNLFFNTFVLHDETYAGLRQTDLNVIPRVQYKHCPRQENGFDCGIFAVACILHLAERQTLQMDTFSQANVTKARSELANAFASTSAVMKRTGHQFRNCFPNLRRESIISDSDIEIITPLHSMILSSRSTRSHPALFQGDGASHNSAITLTPASKSTKRKVQKQKEPPHELTLTMTAAVTTAPLKDPEDDEKLLVEERQAYDVTNPAIERNNQVGLHATTTTSTSTISTNTSMKQNLDDQDQNSASTDTVMYQIMDDMKLDGFKELVDVNVIIEEYQKRTGNRLRIQKSKKDKFRVYRCCEHVNCTFQVRFSRRRSDGYFVLATSQEKSMHSTDHIPPKVKGDRKFKKRRKGMLKDVIVRVLETKDGAPTPGDIMKTAKSKNNNTDIHYNIAWRALNEDTLQGKTASLKNFELIVPYLEEMTKLNPLSVMGYTLKENTGEIVDLHFFPGFVNDALRYVRPVISVDAAHLKSKYTGMLYVASVKSGNDDIYPIGFMIATGNEDKKNWTKMLRLLRQAFPIITDYQREHPFVFVSDRDKGLKPALRDVFPNNRETSCAFHIKENVRVKYGHLVASRVMAMAKTYSKRYYNYLLDAIRGINPAAAEYINNITDSGVVWTNSQWSDSNLALPPRFGEVTSNTSESVNSMFDSARDLVWMDALEKIVDLMLTRICTCRARYVDHDDSKILPPAENLLQRRWESTANLFVQELEEGSDIYHCKYSGTAVVLEEHPQDIGLPLQEASSHIVKPGLKWCSCGVWQQTLFPCHHACAVYRHMHGADMHYISVNLVHDYYKYGFAKSMFKKNILPVSLDTLAYDRETKPPFGSKQQAGRPKKHARIRRRSNFFSDSESNISCGNCGQRGHNIRTCSRRPPRLTRDDSLTS